MNQQRPPHQRKTLNSLNTNMTQEEMTKTAELIAKDSPSILLKALRDNGFWLYTINTVDVEEDVNGEKLTPITDDDISYVNINNKVADVVNYEDIMNKVILEINDYRIAKDSSN